MRAPWFLLPLAIGCARSPAPASTTAPAERRATSSDGAAADDPASATQAPPKPPADVPGFAKELAQLEASAPSEPGASPHSAAKDQHVFRAALTGRGGLLVSTDAVAALFQAGWAKADAVVVITPSVDEAHLLALAAERLPQGDFFDLLERAKAEQIPEALRTSYRRQRWAWRNRIRGIAARAEQADVPHFAADSDPAKHLTELARGGRLFAFASDDVAKTLGQVSALARAHHLATATVYSAELPDFEPPLQQALTTLFADDTPLVLRDREQPDGSFFYLMQRDVAKVPLAEALLRARVPKGGDPHAPLRETTTEPLTAAPCGPEIPGMRCVPGAEFLRGSDRLKREKPSERIWVDTFYMDVTEVTVEAFDACVQKGDCPEARTLYADFSRPKQPKVGVSFFDARGFCRAQGKRLPTEAEWERAARGMDGRAYPWGNERATCEQAIIKTRAGRSCGVKKSGREPDKGRTFEVQSRAPNALGLYDMSGNAWEWVNDWYSTSYTSCGDWCRVANPPGPCGGADDCKGHNYRVLRGGSWYWDADYATTTFRQRHFPNNDPYHHYGFRCAKSL